jgi:hypothetical protein
MAVVRSRIKRFKGSRRSKTDRKGDAAAVAAVANTMRAAGGEHLVTDFDANMAAQVALQPELRNLPGATSNDEIERFESLFDGIGSGIKPANLDRASAVIESARKIVAAESIQTKKLKR